MASSPEGAPPTDRRQGADRAPDNRFGRFGLRFRLGAIAVAVAVPLIAANVAWLAIDVADARNAATAETGRLAEAVASALDQALEGTRAALITIAAEEELQTLDPARCTDELEFLLPQFPEYSNLSAAGRDGLIFCSAAPTSGPVTIDDRPWFQVAIAGRSFVLGSYQIGRIVGRPLIIGAVPIRSRSGEILGTVQASITLESLASIVGQVDLPDGAALTVLDDEGTVLVRLPDGDRYVGQRPPESELVDAVLAGHPTGESGHGEATAMSGLDGVERLYAIDGVATGDDALHVAVGFSVDQAYAGAARRFGAGMIVLVAALAVAVALMVAGARRLILRPVESLVGAANRIAGGDLAARTGLGGTGEIGRLADAFDRMADSVQQRVADRTLELSAAVARLEGVRAEAERAREAAESARAEAERANQSKTEFLSRMSHELRTPLNSVIGFAQILEMDGLRSDQAEAVGHILRSGRHLLDLINEVLDISRIEAGTLSTSPEPVDVDEAVREAVDLVSALAHERGLTIEIVPAGDALEFVRADRQRLKQILLNLLSNAIKFNRASGLIEVAVRRTPAGRCRISVRDEGPGIDDAMRDRAFAPFDRLGAEGGRIEGTGLGLSLSRALAERMNGSLDFESVVGTGSTFWVELPIADEGPATPTRVAPPAAGAGSHGTVLYIEDNLSNLQLVTRIFERHGDVRVVPAMLGGLGLELARDRPDVVLLDLHLPDMSGEEILARLKADPTTRAIPVVVMSADASPGLLDRLMAMGASAFVTKPIAIGEFLAVMEELLSGGPASATAEEVGGDRDDRDDGDA